MEARRHATDIVLLPPEGGDGTVFDLEDDSERQRHPSADMPAEVAGELEVQALADSDDDSGETESASSTGTTTVRWSKRDMLTPVQGESAPQHIITSTQPHCWTQVQFPSFASYLTWK